MKQKPYCYALSTPIQTSTIVCFKEYKPEWDFTIPLYLEPVKSEKSAKEHGGMMGKRTLKFNLEVEIEIDGNIPPASIINERMIVALNDGMPSIVFDDDELDCMVCVNSWGYTHNV